MRLSGLLLALCAIAIGPAAAQTPTSAQVRGRVVDQSGLVMPGADVALTNEASPDTRHAITDTEGRFVFAGVPAGTYGVTVTFPGLRRAESAGIALRGGDDRTLDDLVLAVEGLEESVMVTARRREENLQDVPMSVTAFSGETLRELRRARPAWRVATPHPTWSLYVCMGSGGGNFAQMFLRGVGATRLHHHQRSRRRRLRGQRLLRASAGIGARAAGRAERIEALRGPQGAALRQRTRLVVRAAGSRHHDARPASFGGEGTPSSRSAALGPDRR